MDQEKTIRTSEQLIKSGFASPTDKAMLEEVSTHFAVAITPTMQGVINTKNSSDPIALQFIPREEELSIFENERSDPIGDEPFTRVKGIVHRYPDRCLLKVISVCPVYCRFCFRREHLAENGETLSPEELERAIQYIENNKDIWEVILTGGEPLFMKPSRVEKLLLRLSEIEHIQVLRIHTRVPVVDPDRICEKMIMALRASKKSLYVVLHANHPNEFTPASKRAIDAIVNAGIPMLSQSVLLKEINDDLATLTDLMRCFVRHRIKPYYLHHPDLARGTNHFRVSIEKGLSLVRALRGNVSGLCQPTYVLDIPGGSGKVSLQSAKCQQTADNPRHYILENYLGEKIDYFDNSE